MRRLVLTDDELSLLSQLMAVGVSDIAQRVQTLQDKLKRAAEKPNDDEVSRKQWTRPHK